MIVRALATVCLAAAASVADAQDAPQAIEPDRPDITNGTHIVEIGMLQIEMGGLYTHAAAGQHAFGSPFTARVGLTDWLEARIGTDGLLTETDGFSQVTGIGNTQLGVKLRLWASPGGAPVLSILPTINLPTASDVKGLGSGEADYTVALLTGTDVGRHAHVDFNYGIGRIGADNGAPHFTQHLLSVSASDAISDNWNPYLEVYWFSRQDTDGGAMTALDTGAIYEIGSRFAIDGGVQVGLTSSAPKLALFGGVSIVVGDVLGSHGKSARQRQAQRRLARRGPIVSRP
jgi:outer membrane putative beta-barrel porin/alpha-amylase